VYIARSSFAIAQLSCLFRVWAFVGMSHEALTVAIGLQKKLEILLFKKATTETCVNHRPIWDLDSIKGVM